MPDYLTHHSALPLPLTPFELMMLVEDRPDYPMVAVIELELRGEIRRDAFEEAFRLVLDRHPLLTARVVSQQGQPTSWVAADRPKICWRDSTEDFRIAAPINLSETAGLRVQMFSNGQQTRQIFELHHACCDGTAFFQFIEELYLTFANLVSSESDPVELRRLSPECLASRNHFASDSSGPLQWLSRCGFGVREAVKFSMRKITPVLTQGRAGGSEVTTNPFLTRQTSSQQLARLRRVAATLKTTLNDLLLRDFFLTIAQWNEGLQKEQAQPLYRLLVPCDLRTPEDLALPACNVMSYSFLTRRREDCNRSAATLEGIRDEMRFIREKNASLYFIRGLEFFHRFLGGIRSLSKPSRCFATALVSNLGNPAQTFFTRLPSSGGKVRIGSLEVESIVAFPPLRQNTRVGMVINTYANQLTVGLHCDPVSMSADESERFMELFLQNLEQTVAENN